MLKTCARLSPLLVLMFTVSIQAQTLKPKSENDLPADQENRLPLQELRTFTQVFKQIRLGYVEEVSDTELLENAITGLLTGLDPHSTYLKADDYKDLQENATGEYGGLGIEVIGENGVIRIISPIDESPAAKAGIQSGDLIIDINDAPVRRMDTQAAIDKLRGEQGTAIKLTIYREGEDAPLIFNLDRDIIQIGSVRSRMLQEHYGYVRISHFQVTSGDDFIAEINALKSAPNKPLKGLIIDLRNNPGGLVPASVKVANALVSKGTLVYTEGRLPTANKRFEAEHGDILQGLPVIVLINGGSASASEIVAGALQDNKRAVLVGTQSFGKGSVQRVIPLDEGRAIKLTTARYFTPSGRSIQAEGIVPDIVIEPAEIRPYKLNQRLREKNLEGHLEGNAEQDNETSGENQEDSLISDNQLYQALNLLKGFALLSTTNETLEKNLGDR
jgi:carboxyl-terminal processing protease